MEASSRQAFLAEAEAQAHDPAYWIGEQGEFARFDVSAAYLSGDASLAIARAIEHIESLVKRRGDGRLVSVAQLAQTDGLPLNIRQQFSQLAEQQPDVCSESEAQNAVQCFFYVLFGHVGG